MNVHSEAELKRNDYDFSASQDDSPIREYKPLSSLKQKRTDYVSDSNADEDIEAEVNQNKENNHSASKLQNQIGDKVSDDKRILEEKNLFRRRVSYVHSEELVQRCNQMIKIPMRVQYHYIDHLILTIRKNCLLKTTLIHSIYMAKSVCII